MDFMTTRDQIHKAVNEVNNIDGYAALWFFHNEHWPHLWEIELEIGLPDGSWIYQTYFGSYAAIQAIAFLKGIAIVANVTKDMIK